MTALEPALLVAIALASAFGSLRCLADHLLASAAIYALAAAGLAAGAAKILLDAL
jgi:hypothetical protein